MPAYCFVAVRLKESVTLYGSHPFALVLDDSGAANGIFVFNSNAMGPLFCFSYCLCLCFDFCSVINHFNQKRHSIAIRSLSLTACSKCSVVDCVTVFISIYQYTDID